MQFFSPTPRLLSILAIVGLLTAPMVTPSNAVTMDDTSMAGMSETASMPDGMPCCPNEKPALPDCAKSCPLAVVCVGSAVSAPAAVTLVNRDEKDHKITVIEDAGTKTTDHTLKPSQVLRLPSMRSMRF